MDFDRDAEDPGDPHASVYRWPPFRSRCGLSEDIFIYPPDRSGAKADVDGGKAPRAPDPLERLIRDVPFFRNLDRVDVARLIGTLEEVRLPAGTLIFTEGAEADALYLLAGGRVRASVSTAEGERQLREIAAPAYFGELGILLDRRTATIRAISDVHLWKLPRQRFEHLARERPGLALRIAEALAATVDQRSREHVGAPLVEAPGEAAESVPPRPQVAWQRAAGAAAAIAVPLLLWPLAPPAGLSPAGWHAVVIVLGAAVGWFFEPVPDFVVALLMAAALGVAGLAPLSVAFAGFTTSSWWVALGAMGLAAAMIHSGLLFRIALFLLRTLPPTHRGQILALLVSGLAVTPLVPLGTARIAVVAPLAVEVSQALGYAHRTRASAALAFAAFIGYQYFSSVFLTGLAMNFFVQGLLPPADQARFDWLSWLGGAAAFGVVLLLGSLAVLLVLFPPETAPRATAEVIARQRRVLAALSGRERVAAAAAVVLLGGLLAYPVLRVDTPWLAVAALAVAMMGGGLDRARFRSAIDWGFLILFGVLLGTDGVMRRLMVDQWIAGLLVPVIRLAGGPGVLVLILALVVIAARVVLQRQPATLLLSLALIPAAPAVGLPPWIVGFVILVAANTWVHPYQSDWYRMLREATDGEAFTDRHGVTLGVALTVITLLAIAASIPYWRLTGILGP